MYEVKASNHLNAVFNARSLGSDRKNFVGSVACETGASPKMLKYDFQDKKLLVIDLLKKVKKEERSYDDGQNSECKLNDEPNDDSDAEIDLSSVEH